jgi:hypothetical protein
MYFVAMSAVFLNFEAGGWVEEADLSVGATGQELWWWWLDVCWLCGGFRGGNVRIGLIRRCSRERALGLCVRISLGCWEGDRDMLPLCPVSLDIGRVGNCALITSLVLVRTQEDAPECGSIDTPITVR